MIRDIWDTIKENNYRLLTFYNKKREINGKYIQKNNAEIPSKTGQRNRKTH